MLNNEDCEEFYIKDGKFYCKTTRTILDKDHTNHIYMDVNGEIVQN